MATVPSNLIPTRLTQLPTAPVGATAATSQMVIVYNGNTYQVTASDIVSTTGVPTSRQVLAGTGMEGGGALATDVTLSIASGGVGTVELAETGVSAGQYGSATTVPVFIVDVDGRITSVTNAPITVSGYVPTSREVIAGDGLEGGGALNADVTLTVDLTDLIPESVFQNGSAGTSTEVSRADHQHPAIDLADDDQVDGLLGLANGGTARSIVPEAGAIVWCGADGLYVGPAGVSGQVLVSGGAGEYMWGSALIMTDQPANVVYAGPVSGPDAGTTFRALVNADIPDELSGKDITIGTLNSTPIGATTPAAGTFTDVEFTGLSGTGAVTVTNILDEDDMTSDSPTALVTQQSVKAYVDSQVTAQDLDFAGDAGTGSVDLDSQVLTIAGTANEVETSASGQTITIGLPATVAVTTVDVTNLEVTNLKAKDGTAAGTIADSTGVVTLASTVLTTADINGGTIDAATIGATTPAAGAFTDVAVNGGITTVESVQFDTTASVTLAEGEVAWDDVSGTTHRGLKGGTVMLNDGLEVMSRCINNTASIIPNGTVVYQNGTSSAYGHVGVAPMLSDGSTEGYLMVGMATEDIAVGEEGYVTYYGLVRDVDTSAFSLGDVLYVSDTVPGGFTNVQPVSPSLTLVIGTVSVVDATNGIIFVNERISPTADLVTYDNSMSTLTASNVYSGLNELDLKKLNISDFTVGITGYATSASSDISGYKVYVTSITDPDYDDPAVNFSTGAVSGTGQLLGSFATEANVIDGNPGMLNVITTGNIRRVSGGGMTYASFYFEIYHRDSSGTETLIGTSGSTGSVTGSGYQQFSATAFVEFITFTSTDRLVVKYYGTKVNGGTDPVYEFQFGGSDPVRTVVPVPLSVVPTPDAIGVQVDTSGFGNTLGPTDSNVQAALDTIDNFNFPSKTGTGASGTWGVAISGNAATATSLAGGIASQVPYQSASGVTAFVTNGTAGQVLISNGTSAPAWGNVDGGTF